MSTLKSMIFTFTLLLVISLSTSTAMAQTYCTVPTPIDHNGGCFGDGAVGDFPAGENSNGTDGNCTSSFYGGVPCDSCALSYTVDYSTGLCANYSYCSPYSMQDEAAFYYFYYEFWTQSEIASYVGCMWSGYFYP